MLLRFQCCKWCGGSARDKKSTMCDYCLLGCTQCSWRRNGFELLKLEDSGLSEDDLKFYEPPLSQHRRYSLDKAEKDNPIILHSLSTEHNINSKPKRNSNSPHHKSSHKSKKKQKLMALQTSMPYLTTRCTHQHREYPKLGKTLSRQPVCNQKLISISHERSIHDPKMINQPTTTSIGSQHHRRSTHVPRKTLTLDTASTEEKKLKLVASQASQTSMPYQTMYGTHYEHEEYPKLGLFSKTPPYQFACDPNLDSILHKESSTHEPEIDNQSTKTSQHRSTQEPRKNQTLDTPPIIPQKQIELQREEASPTYLHQQSTPKSSTKCIDPQRRKESKDKSTSKMKDKSKKNNKRTIFGYLFKKHHHSKRHRRSQSAENDPLLDESASIPADERSWEYLQSPPHSINTTNESVCLSPVQSLQSHDKHQRDRRSPKIVQDYYLRQHYHCSKSRQHNHQNPHHLHDLRPHSRKSCRSKSQDRPTTSQSNRTDFGPAKSHQEINGKTPPPNSSGSGNKHSLTSQPKRKQYPSCSMILTETSESTLVAEETKVLEYTTSSSVLEKPSRSDHFYSPCESDAFMGEWKKSTKNTADLKSPAHGEKVYKASSTDGFDYISLSSGDASRTDRRDFGNLDVLH